MLNEIRQRVRLAWNGEEWEATFDTGEIVRCVRRETLESFLRGVESNLRRKESHMLVLTRKQNETIKIGDNVTIMLVKISGGRARIGIDAAGLAIVRGELIDEKAKTQETQADPRVRDCEGSQGGRDPGGDRGGKVRPGGRPRPDGDGHRAA